MSGTSNRHRTSPDAVRALRAYFTKHPAPGLDLAHLVRKLDEAGFCVIARDASFKPPAGRGNEAFKKVKEQRRIEIMGKRCLARRASGDALIGKSHSQSILNGG